MDPTACYREMIELRDAGQTEEAQERAAYLLGWIANGGFPPEGLTLQETHDVIKAVLDTECYPLIQYVTEFVKAKGSM